jgi:hypothetical protein
VSTGSGIHEKSGSPLLAVFGAANTHGRVLTGLADGSWRGAGRSTERRQLIVGPWVDLQSGHMNLTSAGDDFLRLTAILALILIVAVVVWIARRRRR